MADYRIDSEILTGIADAIRGKTNKGDVITPENMASEISSITTGGGENKLAKVADGSVTEITAEDLAGATKIREYFCYNMSSLRKVTIPNGVLSLGNRAFMGCLNIADVELPVGLNTIGQRCFMNCAVSLRNIVIPDSVVKIDSNAFASCIELRTLFIGSGITTIGASAFEDCAKMESVTIKATTPPSIQANTFDDVPADCAYYVPSASVEAYKAATNWSARADYIFPLTPENRGEVYATITLDDQGRHYGEITPELVYGEQYYIEDTLFTATYGGDGGYVAPPTGTSFTGTDGNDYYVQCDPSEWYIVPLDHAFTANLTVTIYKVKE